MQDSIKDNVINQIKTVKVLADHADDYKVKLTSDEKKQLDESVKSFTKNELGKRVMKMCIRDSFWSVSARSMDCFTSSTLSRSSS